MPLSDINPGGALTATNSNDAPLLEFRVKRSGTITPLGVVESIAHEPSGDLLKGRLAFLTNNGSTITPQMLISEEGNVGIGTQDPQAKLHVEGNAMFKGPLKIGSDMSVDGNATLKGKVNATSLHVEADATFKGPLTIHEAVTVPSLTVRGAAAIGESLSVGGDVVVAGKLKAASIESDEAKLAGDLSIRLEQLNDRINEQNERLSGLESLPRREFLDFTPQLDGDWVGGTTSPEFVIGGEGAQVSATGNMNVDLPDLSKIVAFHCFCEFDVQNEIVPQLIVRLRRKLGSMDEVTIVELINDQQETEQEGVPNLETHLVQRGIFEYLIQADVNFFSASAAVIPKGRVILTGFQVVCIVGGV